jgi:uncharacterized protein (DUF58 family)
MLSEKIKKIDIKVQRNLSSFLVGNYKTFFKWRWLEFADFREYVPWDDTKNIDFIVSAREWKTIIRQYKEERELSIIFLLDLNPTMNFWLLDKTKLEILEEVFMTLSYAAIANNDKIWIILQENNDNFTYLNPKKWKANLFNLLKKIEEFSKKEINFNINSSLNYLNNLVSKDNLVFVISDKVDIDEKILKISSIKNELIFISVFDNFENTLEWMDWIISFSDFSGNSITINLNDKKKKWEYLAYRQEKLENFRKLLSKLNIKYLLLDNKTNIFSKLFLMFKK